MTVSHNGGMASQLMVVFEEWDSRTDALIESGRVSRNLKQR